MIKASEYCVSVFDGTHESPKPVKTGYKLLTSKNILNGYIDSSDAYFISEQDYKSINKRSKVVKWDILFSMIGTVGNVCLITEDNLEFAIKNMGVFSTRDEYKAKWLYFYLKSPIIKKKIKNQLNGAVQKFLPLGWLRNLEIPEYKQDHKKIVDLLWSIETKININNSINIELESMVKSIYDYWFLQFEFPNEMGMPFRLSGGEIVWNKDLKREIPSGWEVRTIKNIESKIITGKTPTTKNSSYFNGNIPFITIGDIRNNMHIVKTEQTLTDIGANTQKNYYIPEGSICVTCIASPGLVGFSTTKSQTNQQINTIICKNQFNRMYLFIAIKDYFLHSKGAKTGNVFANMSKEDFSNIKLLYPDEKVLKEFENRTNAIIEMVLLKSKENLELISLLDFLLPNLMHGQVTFMERKL